MARPPRNPRLPFMDGPMAVGVVTGGLSLGGPAELRSFLDRYAAGPTTYSWRWDHHDVSQAGDVAWLLASGRETAVTGEQRTEHPYRMTMVAQRRLGAWLLLQVHGSSPQE